MVRLSLVLFPADSDQVHKLPKNRPIDRIDVNRLRKNNDIYIFFFFFFYSIKLSSELPLFFLIK